MIVNEPEFAHFLFQTGKSAFELAKDGMIPRDEVFVWDEILTAMRVHAEAEAAEQTAVIPLRVADTVADDVREHWEVTGLAKASTPASKEAERRQRARKRLAENRRHPKTTTA